MKSSMLLIVLLLALYANPVFADACLHAPPPRLKVGDEAMIVSDNLNLRALPAVATGINIRMYSGNAVTVIDGPSCNGLYSWWRVETASGQRGWVAEGAWEQYYVVPAEDAEQPPTPFEAACLLDFDPFYCM